ncbi:6-pyruvoyl trahydropterin synthase family protein [Salinisphaera aquimarina]|uniref:6-carboxy-5,6,7,8-tetrahydropterin synthase n=1 Tax=Salinisphaera aquimarina TaxID=2094031 RepID=A0ABV7ENW8_9GAMM
MSHRAGRTPGNSDTLELFVDHVTHVDCGVLDPRSGLSGHTWLVDATLTGQRDASGMLFDFGPAKRLLKREIDALIDHRLLVPRLANGIRLDGPLITLTAHDGAGIDYRGPAAGVAIFDAEAIDSTLLERWLTERIAPQLPANIDALTLALREERIDGPHYHYCHGLKSHDGNCQRMGHGHRCRLAIAIDGVDQPEIAQQWADRWQGIFIGQREDWVETDRHGRHHFAYRAEQGDFAFAIDAGRCVILDGPPTVENIADHIAGELRHAHPAQHIAVRAYEGVGKGAVARRG